jgi:hypothetical protein
MAKAPVPIGERIHVDLRVDEEVNYSLLHNNRELLKRLTLTKLVDSPLRDIAVTGRRAIRTDTPIWCSTKCSSPWRRR